MEDFMPSKKKKTVDVEKTLKSDKAKLDKEVSKSGLTYSKIAGGLIVLIGLILVLVNLTGIILAFVGLVLIYFGLRMVGYNLKL